jgi:chaperone modulatory protein CbpM
MPRTLTLTAVCRTIPGLTEDTLQAFVREDWIRPVRLQGEPLFSDADIARIRLILDLRATLEVEEETLPIVLSLLDQLYATRRQLRRVIDEAGPEIRQRLAALLQDG